MNNTIYIANGSQGLVVLRSVPNVQFAFEVDGPPDTLLVVEAASSLASPAPWTSLFTTNSSTMPFVFTDTDVQGKQKFYRIVEP